MTAEAFPVREAYRSQHGEPGPEAEPMVRLAEDTASRLAECAAAIREDGLMVPGQRNARALHPAANLEVKLAARLERQLAALGLAPAAWVDGGQLEMFDDDPRLSVVR